MARFSHTNLEHLLYDDVFADFSIVCGDKEFKVHRAILSANSHFFRSVCTLPFQEAQQSRLQLPEDDPEIIARVLLYIYTGDYSDHYTPTFGTNAATPSINHSVSQQDQPIIQRRLTIEEDGGTVERVVSTEQKEGRVEFGNAKVGQCLSSISNELKPHEELMEINAKVYLCAKKIDLTQLANVAAHKFMSSMDQLFFNIVRAQTPLQIVYENTSTEDLCLRLSVTRWCVSHHHIISSSPDLLALIRMHESTAWTIASEVMMQLKIQDEAIKQVKMEMGTRDCFLQNQLRAKEAELEALVSLLKSTHHCDSYDRRCMSDDSSSFRFETPTSSERQYRLICRTCGKSHYSMRW